ncbi:MAG: lipid-transfer protein [Polyangiaceae bacterium]
MSARRVNIVGVGVTKFAKPGQGEDYPTMVAHAVRSALRDAGVQYAAVQQSYAGYVFGESTTGQRALYGIGLTGAPIFNVNNACATGSTALVLGRQAIESESAECVLVVGFEEMEKGAIVFESKRAANPLDRHIRVLSETQEPSGAPLMAQMFGGAGREYRAKYGTRKETFAKVAVKSRKHASENPLALFTQPLTVEEVLASDMIYDPLTRLQCCAPTCGAAAVVLASDAFAKKHGHSTPVYVAAQAMTTDYPTSFEKSLTRMVGYDMTVSAASKVYDQAGLGPEDVQVCELHDCFTTNEVLSYEALGLCNEGEAERFISDGLNTYGGQVVTNPSGGLLSKGHPLGATGVAQCAELVWQLRGRAEKRQVANAKVALQHNIGIGGACVVTMYRRE